MELRAAESKSLIRRKTVKVNMGQAAAKPDATRTAFSSALFHFLKRFGADFLLLKSKTCPYFGHRKHASDLPYFILSLWAKVCHFSRVKATVIVYSLRLNNLLEIHKWMNHGGCSDENWNMFCFVFLLQHIIRVIMQTNFVFVNDQINHLPKFKACFKRFQHVCKTVQ